MSGIDATGRSTGRFSRAAGASAGGKLEVTVEAAEARVLLAAIRGLPADLRREIAKEVGGLLRDVAAETRRLLGSRRGRRRAGARTAVSAPGEPPARQTGALARSIRIRKHRGGMSGRVVSLLFKSRFLETGTQTGLAPRPFLSVALETKRGALQARIGAAVVAAFLRLP
jgi:hypothetical protein